MKYEVSITKVEAAKACIEAENASEAEDIAFERLMHREINLAESDIPGEVSISVTKSGGQNPSPHGSISIYWHDLIPAKQAEILAAFGDNCNYDVFPIVEIPISEEDLE